MSDTVAQNLLTKKTILIAVKQCSICIDKIHMKKDACTTLCKHTFHKTCIDTWNKKHCPVCRQDTGLQLNLMHDASDDDDDDDAITTRAVDLSLAEQDRLHARLDAIHATYDARLITQRFALDHMDAVLTLIRNSGILTRDSMYVHRLTGPILAGFRGGLTDVTRNVLVRYRAAMHTIRNANHVEREAVSNLRLEHDLSIYPG